MSAPATSDLRLAGASLTGMCADIQRCDDVRPTARTGQEAPHTTAKPQRERRQYSGSHHAYALRTLADLTVSGWEPVFYQGRLYVLDANTAIWIPVEREDLFSRVAELNDGRAHCYEHHQYVGITDQLLSIASNRAFFEDAPVGIACAGSFFRVQGSNVMVEPLGPNHRQRVMLDFEPLEANTPLFDNFLRQTFRSDNEGEESQQRALVQEIAGGVLLGVMPRFQKAVLFYDPYGRAGKGTLERIITQLVPQAFAAAVSPFKWDREYYLADLVGRRLNVVGELPEGEAIPSANFKSVLGGDLLAGRSPRKSVVTFRNEAAHIFTSNHLVATRDHSEAFFSRWLLVHFPNSLLRTGGAIDTGLAERIISAELPGIAHWALRGGTRLLEQGRFSSSVVHDRLMEEWRRSSNSLDQFIHECCELGETYRERRKEFYATYKAWCHEGGRKPFSKSNVKDMMERRVGLHVRIVQHNGYETLAGIRIREDCKDNFLDL